MQEYGNCEQVELVGKWSVCGWYVVGMWLVTWLVTWSVTWSVSGWHVVGKIYDVVGKVKGLVGKWSVAFFISDNVYFEALDESFTFLNVNKIRVTLIGREKNPLGETQNTNTFANTRIIKS